MTIKLTASILDTERFKLFCTDTKGTRYFLVDWRRTHKQDGIPKPPAFTLWTCLKEGSPVEQVTEQWVFEECDYMASTFIDGVY